MARGAARREGQGFEVNEPIFIELDRRRQVRWTGIAEARLSRAGYTVERAAGDMRNREKALYALCAFLWAALVILDCPWNYPEELGEHLKGDDKQLAGLKAVRRMLTEAGIMEDPDESKKKAGREGNTLNAGQSASSNSARGVPTTASLHASSMKQSSTRGRKRRGAQSRG